ncbi:uncharacterized protein [Drosophila bipectinata]|uniref:uncharacterized protein n=1 Tax=Drosophila bipectinata TaxID=42026 RepID=UPI0038B32939
MSTRNLRIDNATYWSDSKTVLQWLTMDPRNFHQFVMHRVAEILETTLVEQWRWIPPKLNVADGATKVPGQTQRETWITGPEFLKTDASNWRISKKQESIIHTSEIRKHVMTTHTKSVVMFNANDFSNWRRLYRAVALVLLFIDRLRAKCAGQDMPATTTMAHVSKAKMLLYKQSQFIAFAAELKTLSAGTALLKGSRLAGLNAYLDNDGVLRTRGRLNAVDIAEDAIILAHGCRITNLIVRSFHEKDTEENILTLMEAQFIINSRPLTFVSLDSEDDAALTPNHLLLGSANGYKPLPEEGMNLKRRWNETQRFGDRFWQRWVKEYAPVLTRRTKWFEKVPPITIGSIVVVVDELLPRNLWLKGRVTDAMIANDGQVRRVTIKTQHGAIERPATKVAVLDVGLEIGN